MALPMSVQIFILKEDDTYIFTREDDTFLTLDTIEGDQTLNPSFTHTNNPRLAGRRFEDETRRRSGHEYRAVPINILEHPKWMFLFDVPNFRFIFLWSKWKELCGDFEEVQGVIKLVFACNLIWRVNSEVIIEGSKLSMLVPEKEWKDRQSHYKIWRLVYCVTKLSN